MEISVQRDVKHSGGKAWGGCRNLMFRHSYSYEGYGNMGVLEPEWSVHRGVES